MDVAYNQHADRARRKNRSSTNLNHLTLAPLTAKLPLNDDDLLDTVSPISPSTPTSYLQGKSAPTTPRLLSRSPAAPRSRSHHRTPSGPNVAKSKSTTHLASAHNRKSLSGVTTPSRKHKDEGLGLRHRNDSDWLLRTGALMSSEAREYKGQAWLVSRQSSTSLAGHDADEDVFEHELAREREIASRHASRRGSAAIGDDDASPYGSRFPSRTHSRNHSRIHSRSHSLTRPKSSLLTPLDRPNDDSYFPHQEHISGPDFVNLDEALEELEQDTSQDDEAAIRRLVRRGQAGAGSWIGGVWSLFSVEENDEESDESDSEDGSQSQMSRSRNLSSRNLAGISTLPEERIPPPKADEGGWRDAAWLLSVASKVMF
ncbi:Fc.00g030660.m01.CDS01 [Cosmosporella sp. VM-42]